MFYFCFVQPSQKKETQINMYSKAKIPNLPTSKIYISKTSILDQKSNSKSYNDEPIDHYRVILKSNNIYTTESIENAQGRYNCFNCNIAIQKRVYFFPINFENEKFAMSLLPHCCLPCVFRSVKNSPQKHIYINYFTHLYGIVVPAPPRELLYLGTSIQKYHEMIRKKQFVAIESKNKVNFFADVKVTSTIFDKSFNLPRTIVQKIDQNNETFSTQEREDTHLMEIVPVPYKDLYVQDLTKIFPPDEASYCNDTNRADTQLNHHMKTKSQSMDIE